MILENLQALGRVHGNIWIRVPVVPGFNDDPEQLEATARFAASIAGVRQVSLLPYHKAGVRKWRSLGKPSRGGEAAPPSAETMEHAADAFRAFGLKIQTGG
jgi:pyruvate formate lyase activating enzyme